MVSVSVEKNHQKMQLPILVGLFLHRFLRMVGESDIFVDNIYITRMNFGGDLGIFDVF